MRKLEKNTRRYFVNLFADYILSKFNKKENTIIQVTDFETFVVVNGQTTSTKVLDLKPQIDKLIYLIVCDEVKKRFPKIKNQPWHLTYIKF